jgi:WD repeat-containing protein 23
MSLKFSGDSKHIVCGNKAAEVLIYDLFVGKIISRVARAHEDEINSVCFANRETSNIVFTGSDDGMVKIWDRRALGGNNRPQGVFVGHAEGITNVASKGDGLYVASNSKD